MQWIQILKQDSYQARYGEAFMLIEKSGITYEIPTAIPVNSGTWRKRNNTVVGIGRKLGKDGISREKYCDVSEKEFYKLGRQLSKV